MNPARPASSALAVATLSAIALLAACSKQATRGPTSGIAAALRESPDLHLPVVTASAPARDRATPQAVHVIVTRAQVRVLGDKWPVAMLPKDPELGLASDDKRDGRRSFRITPLAQAAAFARRESERTAAADAAPEEPRPIDETASTVIVADAATTYRIIAEVVGTSGESGVGFAVKTPDLEKPHGIMVLSAMRARKSATVIDVTYQRDALTIKVGDRNIGQGCKDGAPGPTVTRERVGDVVRVLAPCLQTLRGGAPELIERVVKMRLEAAAPLSTLVALLEAFRAADFTSIVLQAPVEPTQ